jgi:L-alanine-DL-glutamate epimerase-like enolase superfamily enzyme
VSIAARIRSVEGIPLRVPFAREFAFAAPHQPMRGEVEVLVVRITTEDGIVGLGETQAWRRQGSGETLAGLFMQIRDHVAPALIGRSAFDIAALIADIDARLAGNLYVMAAAGDALYDAAARTLNRPVHDLLGGRCRTEIPVGLAIGISGDGAEMIEAAERAYARGYRHIRVKIGLDAARDLECVTAVRRHFQDRVVLRADANGGMNYGDALRLLTKLEPLDLDIVEQPLPGWNLDGMAALARAIRIPLSADESLTTAHSLVEIGRRQAARVIQTKSAKNGGIHHIRHLWALADTLGIGIFPGNHPSTGLNVAAVAHLAAAWSGPLLVGDFQTGADDMIAEDILQESVRIENGHVIVPTGPGLGVVLDDAKVARLRVDL